MPYTINSKYKHGIYRNYTQLATALSTQQFCLCISYWMQFLKRCIFPGLPASQPGIYISHFLTKWLKFSVVFHCTTEEFVVAIYYILNVCIHQEAKLDLFSCVFVLYTSTSVYNYILTCCFVNNTVCNDYSSICKEEAIHLNHGLIQSISISLR